MTQGPSNVSNVVDIVSVALWVGVLKDAVPVMLGLLGVLWFLLRFINLIRVNVYNKDPWRGMG